MWQIQAGEGNDGIKDSAVVSAILTGLPESFAPWIYTKNAQENAPELSQIERELRAITVFQNQKKEKEQTDATAFAIKPHRNQEKLKTEARNEKKPKRKGFRNKFKSDKSKERCYIWKAWTFRQRMQKQRQSKYG